jgi:hypothetical protein
MEERELVSGRQLYRSTEANKHQLIVLLTYAQHKKGSFITYFKQILH